MPSRTSLQKLSQDWTPQTQRRGLLITGLLAGVGGALSFKAQPSSAQFMADIAILNAAIDLEQQAIWAYSTAAGLLSDTDVGRTVLAVASKNLGDHEQHRDVLASAVQSLGGTPAPALESYDLSTYIDDGEGGLGSDADIARLALALEYDAALAYNDAFSQLIDRDLVAAASTIGPNEIAHATGIRAVFNSLDPSIVVVPSAFVSADTRDLWIIKA